MDNIRVIVDGKEYAQEQFEKDMIRMFDAYRYDDDHMGEMNCKDVSCTNCPLNKYCDVSRPKTFEEIKIIYRWAQEHPLITNFDMLKKTFGNDVIHYVETRPYKEKWLDEEYKKPKGGNKNDD